MFEGWFDMPVIDELTKLRILKRRCSLDIGGTLAKLAYVSNEAESGDGEDLAPTIRLDGTNGDAYYICFRHFFTRDIKSLIDFVKERNIVPMINDEGERILHVTGGGSFKFCDMLEKELNVKICRCDEMRSIMNGLTMAVNIRSEVFLYNLAEKQRQTYDLHTNTYPYLVVNVGSGVSILKAEAPGKYERVTGTCIGGGTVFGLAKLLFGAESFEEVVNLASNGTDCLDLKVMHLIGDSAGSTHTLPGDTLASSFGRLYVNDNSNSIIRREDIARSAIHMVSYNLGYLAYLVAKIHNIQTIFFSGKYIHNHDLTMQSISQGVTFYDAFIDRNTQTGGKGGQPPTNNNSESTSRRTSVNSPLSQRRSRDAPTTPITRPQDVRQDQSKMESLSLCRQDTFYEFTAKLQSKQTDQFDETDSPPIKVLFLRHDGYLGTLGALVG